MPERPGRSGKIQVPDRATRRPAVLNWARSAVTALRADDGAKNTEADADANVACRRAYDGGDGRDLRPYPRCPSGLLGCLGGHENGRVGGCQRSARCKPVPRWQHRTGRQRQTHRQPVSYSSAWSAISQSRRVGDGNIGNVSKPELSAYFWRKSRASVHRCPSAWHVAAKPHPWSAVTAEAQASHGGLRTSGIHRNRYTGLDHMRCPSSCCTRM